MKRNLIYAAALSLAMLCMTGCDGAQEQPAPTPAVPEDQQVVAVKPVVEDVPAPVEEPQEEIEAPSEPVYEMTPGVWLAETDVGYSNYYYFDTQSQTGSYVSLEYGLGMPFSYEGAGTELVFHLDGHEADKTACVEHLDETSFTLIWEDSLPEKLQFVSEGQLEDFHFYSNYDLAMLAMEHYVEDNGDAPSQVGSMTNDDNTVTIQLYDNLGDHNSTAAWYVVDRFTAAGIDLTSGEEIELLPEEEDVVPEEPDQPEEMPTSTGDEISAETEAPVEPLPDTEVPGEVSDDNNIV